MKPKKTKGVKKSNYDKQILLSAQKNDIKGVMDALKNGADINAKGEFNYTSLNYAAEYGYFELVKLLVEKGADLENKGGAGKTPLMCAVVDMSKQDHNKIVSYLIGKGALITNDILSALQLKVNILKENAESGMVLQSSVNAWQSFLNYIMAARAKQELPEIIKILKNKKAPVKQRTRALEGVKTAVWQGFDISSTLKILHEVLTDSDKDIRFYSAASLVCHYIRKKDVKNIQDIFKNADKDVKEGGINAFVALSKAGVDMKPFLKIITKALDEKEAIVRNDAVITVGYAATNGLNVLSVLPKITELLSDQNKLIRQNSAWTIYRIAKYVGDASSALLGLKKLSSDKDKNVSGMALEAIEMIKSKKKK